MIIYGEFLFLENFITGALLLLLTAFVFGERLRKLRLLLGAALCGAAGFTIFAPISGIAAIIMRTGIAAAAVYIGIGASCFDKFIKKAGIFLALTVMSGGAVMALMLRNGIPSLSGSGAFYIPPLTYINLICFGIITFVFSYWIVTIIKKLKIKNTLCGTAEVKIGDECIAFSAMIDTGNYLKEPMRGRPVILIGERAAAKIKNHIGDERYVIIPFSGAGVRNGILEGIRSDSIYFRGNEIKDVVIAFYDGEFEDSEIILGRDFLDRGISNNENDEGKKREQVGRPISRETFGKRVS